MAHEPITTRLQKMQRFVDCLLKLNVNFDEKLAIDIILNSLPPCYDQFRMTYHMNKEEITLSKPQGLLRTVESNLKGKSVVSTPTTTSTHVLAIGHGKGEKRKAPSKSRKPCFENQTGLAGSTDSTGNRSRIRFLKAKKPVFV